jgi:membrane protease YdiL (CAAX protease family)
MQQIVGYLLILMAVPGLLALFLPAGKVKKVAGGVTLVLGTAVVLLFIGNIISGSGRLMKSSTGMPADKDELQLRLTYAIQVGMHEVVTRMDTTEAQRKKFLADSANPSQAYDMAEGGLAEAIARGDESPVTKAKIAILLYGKEVNRQHSARPVHPLLHTATKPKAELPEHLRDPEELAKQLQKNSDVKIAELGWALEVIFSNERIAKSEIDRLTTVIENGLPFGWYRDALLRIVSNKSGGNERLRELIQQRDAVYLRTFLGAALVVAIAAVSTVIGTLVILIELALVSRRRTVAPDAVGLDVDPLTVYKVFIAWFCTQAVISVCLQQLVKTGFKLPADPFNMAIVTAVTYVIANVPALFYIYFFALRPRGLKFRETLKLRTQTPTAGPFKLVLAGYLGWCAAFPLVMLTAWIAGVFMNSQGSENPVISQIMLAANAPDPIVILLFYLTIAVMAPICEETVFRGFIYGSLRKRFGAALAVLSSAMIFGLVHFDKGGIMGLIAIGIVLAYLYERTRSLLPCMITHGLWNGAMFTATLILFGTH